MPFRRLLPVLAAAAASAAPAPSLAAVLTPVAVTASSTFPFFGEYRPENLIDGSGLSLAGLHDSNFAAMWLTDQSVQAATLTFDLGASYALTGASIWNYNFGVPQFASSLRRGVRDFTVDLSADGIGFAQAFAGTLAQGTGQPLAAEDIAFAGAGRFVRINILNNYASEDFDAAFTGSGLSEVRFGGDAIAAVPEPASWAMMISGVGLAGAGLRRRRAVNRSRTTFGTGVPVAA